MSNPHTYMTVDQVAESIGLPTRRIRWAMRLTQIIPDARVGHRGLYGPAKVAAILKLVRQAGLHRATRRKAVRKTSERATGQDLPRNPARS